MSDDRLITPPEADAICGTSRTRRYELLAAGLFPKPIYLGRAIRFSERECREFVQARIAERDAEQTVAPNLAGAARINHEAKLKGLPRGCQPKPGVPRPRRLHAAE